MAVVNGYLGKNFLLAMSDEAGTPVFTTVGGIKASDFDQTVDEVDVTNKDNHPDKTLLGGGIRSMSVSGAGIFRNETTQRALIVAFNTGALRHFRVTSGNGSTWEAQFLIKNFKLSGAHDGAEEFQISLASSGPVTFTAGAA